MMVNRRMIRQYGMMIRQYGLMIRQYGMMIDHGEYNDDPTIRHDDRIMICEAGLYLSIYIHVLLFLRGCDNIFSTRWGGVGWGWVQEVRSGDDDDKNVRQFFLGWLQRPV